MMQQKRDASRFAILCIALCMVAGCEACITVVEPPSLTLDEPTEAETPGGHPSDWGPVTDPNMEYPSRTASPAQDTPGGSPEDWGPVTDPNMEMPSSRPNTSDDTGETDSSCFQWGTIRPRLGFSYDLFGDGRRPIDPFVAHQAGLGDISLEGKNRASGDIFDFRIKSNIGESFRMGIPFGSFVGPSDSGYQRMVLAEEKEMEVPAGGMLSFPLTGFCADPKKYPPPPRENEPGLGWMSMPPLGLQFFKRPWQPTEPPALTLEKPQGGGMTTVEPPALTLKDPSTPVDDEEEDDIFNLSPLLRKYYRYITPEELDVPDDAEPEIYRDPFFEGFLMAPYIPQTVKRLQDEGRLPATGFNPEKEWLTESQWLFWKIFGNYTPADGREQIEKQTEGRDIPPEKKDELNENLWEGVDLTEKELKVSVKMQF
ncbi:MAG: hypothetical protein JW844_00045 [Candidatus Omnitrophica bacterium]|nr:hypothetical protein [Candidatus Omnitrophota bacterium]